ncbi:protein kinase [Candidatus Sumerlaeota bacterium]|nr:protein kinase [Candidatus Sumerlaeota bacterium]
MEQLQPQEESSRMKIIPIEMISDEPTKHDANLDSIEVKYEGEDERDPFCGRILEKRYELDEIIGHGGMGMVYRGRQLRLRRPVAVKILRPELRRNSGFMQRFETEALAMAKCVHENIVSIYDVHVPNDPEEPCYIAMELVSGCELGKFLKSEEKNLTIRAVIELLRQTARGIDAAHSKQIVHRDIKPGNIIVTLPQRVVKIMDFGIARVRAGERSSTSGDTIIGTPAYMAPEQLSGGTASEATDIYAFGATIYRLFARRYPADMRNKEPEATLRSKENPIPLRKQNPAWPATVEQALQRALSPDPEQRPESAMELVEQIEYALESLVMRPFSDFFDPDHRAELTAQSQPERPPKSGAAAAMLLALLLTGLAGWAMLKLMPAATDAPVNDSFKTAETAFVPLSHDLSATEDMEIPAIESGDETAALAEEEASFEAEPEIEPLSMPETGTQETDAPIEDLSSTHDESAPEPPVAAQATAEIPSEPEVIVEIAESAPSKNEIEIPAENEKLTDTETTSEPPVEALIEPIETEDAAISEPLMETSDASVTSDTPETPELKTSAVQLQGTLETSINRFSGALSGAIRQTAQEAEARAPQKQTSAESEAKKPSLETSINRFSNALSGAIRQTTEEAEAAAAEKLPEESGSEEPPIQAVVLLDEEAKAEPPILAASVAGSPEFEEQHSEPSAQEDTPQIEPAFIAPASWGSELEVMTREWIVNKIDDSVVRRQIRRPIFYRRTDELNGALSHVSPEERDQFAQTLQQIYDRWPDHRAVLTHSVNKVRLFEHGCVVYYTFSIEIRPKAAQNDKSNQQALPPFTGEVRFEKVSGKWVVAQWPQFPSVY